MERVLYLLLILLLTACSSAIKVNYYEPALFKTDISYLPKPMSVDTVRHSNYVSVGYMQKETSTEEEKDLVHAFQLNLSRAHTFKHLNISYGASGLTGYFKNNRIESYEPFYFKTKPFSSLALRGSVNTYVNKNYIDYRLLGVEFAYSREFGAFKTFRDEINSQPHFYSAANHELFTAGLSSEVIFHTQDDVSTQVGIRLFAGKTFTKLAYEGVAVDQYEPKKLKPYMASIAVFFQRNRFNGVLEGGVSPQLHLGYRF